MKALKLLLVTVVFSCIIFESNGQIVASMYNVNRNDQFDSRYDSKKDKERKFLKGVMVTGLLVGGLIIANEAQHHDYFVGNTTIYGVGGIMTVLATGLVITSTNFINKQINFACTNNGLTVRLKI